MFLNHDLNIMYSQILQSLEKDLKKKKGNKKEKETKTNNQKTFRAHFPSFPVVPLAIH